MHGRASPIRSQNSCCSEHAHSSTGDFTGFSRNEDYSSSQQLLKKRCPKQVCLRLDEGNKNLRKSQTKACATTSYQAKDDELGVRDDTYLFVIYEDESRETRCGEGPK